MSVTRRFGLLLGVSLVLVGLGVAFAPGLAGGLAPDSQLLVAVAVIALVLGGAAVRTRLTATGGRIELPTPERPRSQPTPGDGFDRQLASLSPPGRRRGARERRAVRDRLDELAVSVLVRDGDSERVARERLARGTWTDDPHAAAFFAEASASDVPLEDRLRAAFSTEPRTKKRARHAVTALAAIAEGERER